MRKVTFKIDDKKYFRKEFEKEGYTESQMNKYPEWFEQFQSNLYFVWRRKRG